jgi:hypothetical protein
MLIDEHGITLSKIENRDVDSMTPMLRAIYIYLENGTVI